MKLYLKYFSIHLKSAMQYKTSFFLLMAGQFLTSFSAFLSVYFMFSRFHSVEGFSFSETLLCFGTVLCSFSLAECFFRGFDTFSGIISNGEFDRIMVRPRNEAFQVIATRIDFARLGKMLQAVLVLVYAIMQSSVIWSFDKIVTLIFMIAGGALLFSGLFLIYACICFFTTEGLEFMNILTDGSREFGSYPLSIYGKEFLRFYTFVVPLACVQFYPLLYLLGRTDNLFNMLAPLAGVLFLGVSWIFWKIGVRHYKSTGS